MALNVNTAVAHSKANALTLAQYLAKRGRGEQTYCARAVRLALEAGGVTLASTRFAWQYGESLISAGFTALDPAPVTYEMGDVVVIGKFPGNSFGHMAIYDGEHWVSDFVQKEIYPGPAYRSKKPPYQIYRYQAGAEVSNQILP